MYVHIYLVNRMVQKKILPEIMVYIHKTQNRGLRAELAGIMIFRPLAMLAWERFWLQAPLVSSVFWQPDLEHLPIEARMDITW